MLSLYLAENKIRTRIQKEREREREIEGRTFKGVDKILKLHELLVLAVLQIYKKER